MYSFLLRLNIVTEYIILIFFFRYIFQNSIINKIISYSIIPFLIYIIIDFYYGDKNSLPNKVSVIEFFIFIIILIYYFFEKMRLNVLLPIYQTNAFWICVGLFLYFTGSFFFLLLLSNVEKSNVSLKNEMMIIYSIVTISKNLILSCSMIVDETKDEEMTELHIPSEIDLGNFSPYNNLN